jgi:hypothetical protein
MAFSLSVSPWALNCSAFTVTRFQIPVFQNGVVIPVSIREIDPYAFSREVWPHSVTYDGTALFLVDNELICSVDSRAMLDDLSDGPGLLIGSNIEVIGANAFTPLKVPSVLFESGTRLREIGREAFALCDKLEASSVPEPVIDALSFAPRWKQYYLKGHPG